MSDLSGDFDVSFSWSESSELVIDAQAHRSAAPTTKGASKPPVAISSSAVTASKQPYQPASSTKYPPLRQTQQQQPTQATSVSSYEESANSFGDDVSIEYSDQRKSRAGASKLASGRLHAQQQAGKTYSSSFEGAGSITSGSQEQSGSHNSSFGDADIEFSEAGSESRGRAGGRVQSGTGTGAADQSTAQNIDSYSISYEEDEFKGDTGSVEISFSSTSETQAGQTHQQPQQQKQPQQQQPRQPQQQQQQQQQPGTPTSTPSVSGSSYASSSNDGCEGGTRNVSSHPPQAGSGVVDRAVEAKPGNTKGGGATKGLGTAQGYPDTKGVSARGLGARPRQPARAASPSHSGLQSFSGGGSSVGSSGGGVSRDHSGRSSGSVQGSANSGRSSSSSDGLVHQNILTIDDLLQGSDDEAAAHTVQAHSVSRGTTNPAASSQQESIEISHGSAEYSGGSEAQPRQESEQGGVQSYAISYNGSHENDYKQHHKGQVPGAASPAHSDIRSYAISHSGSSAGSSGGSSGNSGYSRPKLLTIDDLEGYEVSPETASGRRDFFGQQSKNEKGMTPNSERSRSRSRSRSVSRSGSTVPHQLEASQRGSNADLSISHSWHSKTEGSQQRSGSSSGHSWRPQLMTLDQLEAAGTYAYVSPLAASMSPAASGAHVGADSKSSTRAPPPSGGAAEATAGAALPSAVQHGQSEAEAALRAPLGWQTRTEGTQGASAHQQGLQGEYLQHVHERTCGDGTKSASISGDMLLPLGSVLPVWNAGNAPEDTHASPSDSNGSPRSCDPLQDLASRSFGDSFSGDLGPQGPGNERHAVQQGKVPDFRPASAPSSFLGRPTSAGTSQPPISPMAAFGSPQKVLPTSDNNPRVLPAVRPQQKLEFDPSYEQRQGYAQNPQYSQDSEQGQQNQQGHHNLQQGEHEQPHQWLHQGSAHQQGWYSDHSRRHQAQQTEDAGVLDLTPLGFHPLAQRRTVALQVGSMNDIATQVHYNPSTLQLVEGLAGPYPLVMKGLPGLGLDTQQLLHSRQVHHNADWDASHAGQPMESNHASSMHCYGSHPILPQPSATAMTQTQQQLQQEFARSGGLIPGTPIWGMLSIATHSLRAAALLDQLGLASQNQVAGLASLAALATLQGQPMPDPLHARATWPSQQGTHQAPSLSEFYAEGLSSQHVDQAHHPGHPAAEQEASVLRPPSAHGALNSNDPPDAHLPHDSLAAVQEGSSRLSEVGAHMAGGKLEGPGGASSEGMVDAFGQQQYAGSEPNPGLGSQRAQLISPQAQPWQEQQGLVHPRSQYQPDLSHHQQGSGTSEHQQLSSPRHRVTIAGVPSPTSNSSSSHAASAANQSNSDGYTKIGTEAGDGSDLSEGLSEVQPGRIVAGEGQSEGRSDVQTEAAGTGASGNSSGGMSAVRTEAGGSDPSSSGGASVVRTEAGGSDPSSSGGVSVVRTEAGGSDPSSSAGVSVVRTEAGGSDPNSSGSRGASGVGSEAYTEFGRQGESGGASGSNTGSGTHLQGLAKKETYSERYTEFGLEAPESGDVKERPSLGYGEYSAAFELEEEASSNAESWAVVPRGGAAASTEQKRLALQSEQKHHGMQQQQQSVFANRQQYEVQHKQPQGRLPRSQQPLQQPQQQNTPAAQHQHHHVRSQQQQHGSIPESQQTHQVPVNVHQQHHNLPPRQEHHSSALQPQQQQSCHLNQPPKQHYSPPLQSNQYSQATNTAQQTLQRYAAFLSSGAMPGAFIDPTSLARMRADLSAAMKAPAAVAGMGYKDLVAESNSDSSYRTQLAKMRLRLSGFMGDSNNKSSIQPKNVQQGAADRQVVLRRDPATGKTVLSDVPSEESSDIKFNAGTNGRHASGGYQYTTLQDTLRFIKLYT